ADLRLPRPVRPRVLGTFAAALGIDTSEAELPLSEYESINAFFVRKLKPGARAWPTDETVIAAPVDGVVGQVGLIGAGHLMQAKGRRYSAAALLDDEVQAQRYHDGAFITLYLSPRHYHRIHTPAAGEIRIARHVPGALLPVNGAAVMHVDALFARNERLITYVDTWLQRIAVVAVGAYNVGRISATYDPTWSGGQGVDWVTNRKAAEAETKQYDPARLVGVGDEIMAFHLGSTVVLLFERDVVELAGALEPGGEVRVGQPIARVLRG
ncbi:MAG TPA: archaetidylserine decarboxylase, partial [Longimicrobiales bacterium]|nr:archaetidylserine decarboxylase [Longimicrobiales bacterium]